MLTISPDLPLTVDQAVAKQFTSNRSGNITTNASYNKDFETSRTDNVKVTANSFSIARNLSEIKEKRKLMESNAQLLFNRLQVLSQEEYKLKKNAFEIKKRSQELLGIRLNREKQVSMCFRHSYK